MNDRLITLLGGGGFLGRYVAQELLAAGARVRIAQRDPRQAFFLKPQGGLGQTQFVAADIARPDSIARAVDGADGVVNLVGAFKDYQRINVDGARTIAQAASAAGAGAFVQISAIGADAASPSLYGRTKAEGEQAVLAAFPTATILRPSVVFGREDQFINRFAGMIATLPVVPVLKAQARFQPVYVGDVAKAVVAALADAATHGGRTYELGGPDILTMAELHRWIGAQIGRTPPMPALPDAVGAMMARMDFLPGAPITRDQWLMLQRDNVADPAAAGLAALGVSATPMGAVAAAWLVQYRRNGRFAAKTA